MNDHKGKIQSTDSGDQFSRPKSISRRALIKGGVTVMPAILTLQSGAALARSSNLIRASSSYTTDGLGRTLCMDKKSVIHADDFSEIYDLGEPPYAEVNIIPGPAERQYYYIEANKGTGSAVTPGAMCERGGTFYFKPVGGGPWEETYVPQGFVASAGAMTSIASYVKDNLI
ncbi:MAG: hypothetical protein IH838_04545 [Proteobacteria bacterium]|nr:hypothetical protein [Pseudomonadota bacterium]